MKHRIPPAAFISYSHDSIRHQRQVLDLTARLRIDGVDVVIDQYEQMPAEGWRHWSKSQAEKADYVLVACTANYEMLSKQMEDRSCKDLPWEGFVISRSLARELSFRNKVLPICFDAVIPANIPCFLRSARVYQLLKFLDYDDLLQHLRSGNAYEPLPRRQRKRWFSCTQRKLPIEYREEEHRDISEALEEAYLRRAELASIGEETSIIQQEIIELRRRLREHGLTAGDCLLDGRLLLQREIGSGGFSTVWKAYDRKCRAVVAVKILHSQYAEDQTRQERFFRGARTMANLRHPGIVRISDRRILEEGYFFFVMEYVSGGDLRRAVLEKSISTDSVIDIVLRVGCALEFAHEHGAFHRDVKPSNILLDHGQHPKLADFDLVRALDTTGGTRTGMLGTVVYAAPEMMARAQDAGAQADVYGLGMTTVFALLGAEPGFNALRDSEEFISRMEIAEEIKSALMKSVAWSTSDRFKSVSEFLLALREAASLQGTPVYSMVASTKNSDDHIISAMFSGEPDINVPKLSRADLKFLHSAAIFPEEIPIPLPLLEPLHYGDSSSDLGETCLRLAEHELVCYRELQGTVEFYPRYTPRPEDQFLQDIQKSFLERYRPESGLWKDLTEYKSYFWKYLDHHLASAGLDGEMADLILDFKYLYFTLEHSSVAHLLNIVGHAPSRQDLDALARCLRKSSGVLDQDASQLANQLLENVPSPASLSLSRLMQDAKDAKAPVRPQLRAGTFGLVVTDTTRPNKELQVTGRAAISFLGRSRIVYSTDAGGLEWWDYSTGNRGQALKEDHGMVTALAVLNQQRIFFSIAASSELFLLNPKTGVHSIFGGEDSSPESGTTDGAPTTSIAVVDDSHLITGDLSGTVHIWQIPLGQRVHSFKAHRCGLSSIVPCAVGQIITVPEVGSEGYIKIWDLSRQEVIREVEVPFEGLTSAVALGERHLFFAGPGSSLGIWAIGNDWVSVAPGILISSPMAVAANRDRSRLAAIGASGQVYVFQLVKSPHDDSGSASAIPLRRLGSAFVERIEPNSFNDNEDTLNEARRVARLLVEEIVLYNEEIVEEGCRIGNIYHLLQDDIDRSRQAYEERVDPRFHGKEGCFYQELVQLLAGGDKSLLGI